MDDLVLASGPKHRQFISDSNASSHFSFLCSILRLAFLCAVFRVQRFCSYGCETKCSICLLLLLIMVTSFFAKKMVGYIMLNVIVKNLKNTLGQKFRRVMFVHFCARKKNFLVGFVGLSVPV